MSRPFRFDARCSVASYTNQSAFGSGFLPVWTRLLTVRRGVVAVFVRAVLGLLRARARDCGVADGRGGAVGVIQRFGGALNLNVHVHALVLNGVFARNPTGALNFHPVPRPTALDVAEVLATVEPRIKRLLDRRGLGEGDDQGSGSAAWADEAPVLAVVIRRYDVEHGQSSDRVGMIERQTMADAAAAVLADDREPIEAEMHVG